MISGMMKSNLLSRFSVFIKRQQLCSAVIIFITGIVLGYEIRLFPLPFFILTFILSFPLFVLNRKISRLDFFADKKRLKFRFWFNLILIFLILIGGCLAGQVQRFQQQSVFDHMSGEYATVIALIDELPQAKTDRVVYRLKIISLRNDESWLKESGRLQMTVYADYSSTDLAYDTAANLETEDVFVPVIEPEYTYGDLLKIRGRIDRPGGVKNPGQFNYYNYLEKQGINALISAEQDQIRIIARNQGNIFLQYIYRLRTAILGKIEEIFPASDAVLAQALLLGEMKGFSSDYRQLFADCGVIHILCVSGLHVGLILVLLNRTLNALRINRLPILKLVLCLLLLFCYALLTGLKPPVLRAFIMISIIEIGRFLSEHCNAAASLALAAWLLLLFDPQNIYNAGFQLSFASTWGILILMPALIRLYQHRLIKISDKIKTLMNIIMPPLLVSLAAQITTLPLIVWHYQQIPLYAPLMNLIIAPIIALIMPLLIICMAAGSVMIWAAWLPLQAVHGLTFLLLEIVKAGASLPGSVKSYCFADIGELVLSYAVILIMCWLLQNWRNYLELRWLLGMRYRMQSVLLITAVCSVSIISFFVPDKLEVHFIDVGQGDCMLIETPGGETIIIDAAGNVFNPDYDLGREVIMPYLQRERINKCDLLVISHPDFDHYGGAEAIVEQVKVEAALVSPYGISYAQSEAENEYQMLLQHLNDKNIMCLTGEKEFYLELKNNIKLKLHVASKGRRYDDSNDASLVLQLIYRQTEFWFTGDVSADVLSVLADRLKAADDDTEHRLTVIKVPHHGSEGSLCEQFYQQLQPVIAVIQVGKNSYGHPSSSVVECLERLNCRVYSTLADGAVVIKSDGRTLKVKTYFS